MAIASRVSTSSHAPRGRFISPFITYPNLKSAFGTLFEEKLEKQSKEDVSEEVINNNDTEISVGPTIGNTENSDSSISEKNAEPNNDFINDENAA